MTRDQQLATKALREAEAHWLRAYGWKSDGAGGWSHSRVEASQLRSFPQAQAVSYTTMMPRLGWP